MLILFSLEIGMLIMRTYALYERSRKVLAMHIVVAVVIVAVGCVSLTLDSQRESVPSLTFHY